MVQVRYDIEIKQIIVFVIFLRFIICVSDAHCSPPPKKRKRKPSYATDHMGLRKGSKEGLEKITQ